MTPDQAERLSQQLKLCGDELDGKYCTRPLGHADPHIAAVGPYREGAFVLARWSQSIKAVDSTVKDLSK